MFHSAWKMQEDEKISGQKASILRSFTYSPTCHLFIHPSVHPSFAYICLSIHPSSLSLSIHLLQGFIINSSTIISSIRPLCISVHKYIHFPSFLPSLFPSFFPPTANPSVYLFNDWLITQLIYHHTYIHLPLLLLSLIYLPNHSSTQILKPWHDYLMHRANLINICWSNDKLMSTSVYPLAPHTLYMVDA